MQHVLQPNMTTLLSGAKVDMKQPIIMKSKSSCPSFQLFPNLEYLLIRSQDCDDQDQYFYDELHNSLDTYLDMDKRTIDPAHEIRPD